MGITLFLGVIIPNPYDQLFLLGGVLVMSVGFVSTLIAGRG